MNKKIFGNQLKKYRVQAGLSQEALAELVECSSIFISYIERGEKSPSLDVLIRLSNVLDISADTLLGAELKSYNTEMLKHLDCRLQELPAQEQSKILEILDCIITIELNNYRTKRINKLC